MSELDPEASVVSSGAVLGGYRIERFIARGGMGDVYEATQLSLDRSVALKILSSRLGDVTFADRFRREARTAAGIDHPNVLPVYEAGTLDDGRLFLAMKLVRGPDLGAVIDERGPLAVSEAVPILTQVAEALDAAHASGLVHRDVKPANVLLEERDGATTAYLSDFGLAKSVDSGSAQTKPGSVLGTVNFMSPEQASGSATVDARTDVYAFGCLVYATLTRQVPYPRDEQAAVLYAHVHEPPPKPSTVNAAVPPVLDRVVERSMAKDPDSRARSTGALMRWATEQLPTEPPAAGVGADTTLIDSGPLPETDFPPSSSPAGGRAPTAFSAAAFAGAALGFGVLFTLSYVLGASL